MLCAAPVYIEKYGAPACPQDLEQHNFIEATNSSIPQSTEWGFTRNGVFEKAVVSGNISINDSMAAEQLALCGAGITVLPDFVVYEDIKNGALVRLLPDYVIGTMPFHAVFPEKVYMPPKVRVYLDFLVQFYQDNPLFNAAET